MEAIMAMVGTRYKFFMGGIIHIFHFSKYSLSLPFRGQLSQFIVKYKIKKIEKLYCHFENFDSRFPENERDFIICSQIKRQFDFRFDNQNENQNCQLFFSVWLTGF
jgi:hypothetical protein